MTVIEQASAKINLSLDILGRRSDGYHELRSVMQTVGLYDTVEITDAVRPDAGYAEETVSLSIEGSPLVPDEKNLALKAYRRFRESCPTLSPAHILLRKRIPMQAGLAGGSADAAAVLRGLNRLCGNPFSTEKLCRMGAKLGADVPFCVQGGACLCEGVGERLTPLPSLPEQFGIVLLKPPCSCSTPEIFREFDNAPVLRMDTDAVLAALQSGRLQDFTSACGNVLYTAANALHPEIGKLCDELMQLGAKPALMSGSGPTVWGLFETLSLAQDAANAVKAAHPDAEVFAVHSV